MIRVRDQIRLSVQKLGLRKRRAAFAIVSVALGVIVVVAVNSLLEGIRDVAMKTLWTEELDKDVIRVYATDNPYEYMLSAEERKQKAKRRIQYLTESVFDEMRGWSEIEAADRPVTVNNVSMDVFATRPRPVSELSGVPEALLRRDMQDAALLAAATNAIPLVVGERLVRLRYNAKTKKMDLDNETDATEWIGRDVTLVLGDNYTGLSRFSFDYEKREYHEVDADDLTARRDQMQRNFASQYDPTVFNTTLSLRGRIVGLCAGNEVRVPLEAALLCEKWLDQRNRLASLLPRRDTDDASYDYRGRRAPKTGEFREGVVVVKDGADIEAVAKRVEEMGFSVATRARAFENQARAFDSSIQFVKRIAYAFGAVVLGLACALLWSTTSRIVSDSRADIGLFRALGATKADIRRLFLSEAALLGTLGAVVGMLLGWGLAELISRWVITFARREVADPEEMLLIPDSIFSIDLKFSLMLLAGAAVVSLLAGWRPASRAANVDPVKALKRE